MGNMLKSIRLKRHYEKILSKDMIYKDNYLNVMQTPKLKKLVLNTGLGAKALASHVPLAQGLLVLKLLTKQKACITYAKKSLDKFKLRKHAPLGCKVSLKGKRMYTFLDHLVFEFLPTHCRDYPLNEPLFSGLASETTTSLSKGNITKLGEEDHSQSVVFVGREKNQKFGTASFSTGFGIQDYFMFKKVPYLKGQ